eukprot:GHVR01154358.1.p1 GENE.GHVR01154358.1~~GHVR01154358.1.p1  ORF type:complete len:104 (+),score=3.81 GHVR01154358.1:134-445(+)
MNLLYERKETNDQVVVIFKPYSMYLLLFVLLALMALTFIPALSSYVMLGNVLMAVAAIVVMMRIVSMFKINQEIRKAMSEDKVSITGGKLSAKNPLTFVIKKS